MDCVAIGYDCDGDEIGMTIGKGRILDRLLLGYQHHVYMYEF